MGRRRRDRDGCFRISIEFRWTRGSTLQILIRRIVRVGLRAGVGDFFFEIEVGHANAVGSPGARSGMRVGKPERTPSSPKTGFPILLGGGLFEKRTPCSGQNRFDAIERLLIAKLVWLMLGFSKSGWVCSGVSIRRARVDRWASRLVCKRRFGSICWGRGFAR